MIAIKDMAGLLNPYAASELVPALKEAVDLPLHLHTHDTSSIQSSTYLKSIEAGIDVVDCSLASMSGLTSQPNLNSVAHMMQFGDRDPELNVKSLNKFSNYWEDLREYYYPFESGLKAGTAEVYDHEIPGGQYSNLRPQAEAIGLVGEDFEKVKKNYAVVNKMFGDIVKVTPSSKVVGDMAIFMTTNNLTADDVLNPEKNLSFPDSVISLMKGELGQPDGGFPLELQKIVLKGEKSFTDLPNAHLKAVDFDTEFKAFQAEFADYCDFHDFLSYKLYPKVFKEYFEHNKEYAYVSKIPTKAFFYGLEQGEEILVNLGAGKTIMVKLMYILEPDENGMRIVGFELNGQTRRIQIKDDNIKVTKAQHEKVVDPENQIGAPLQGKLSNIMVKVGQQVDDDTALFVIEAMKMETTITCHKKGVIKSIKMLPGEMVVQDDLVIEIE